MSDDERIAQLKKAIADADVQLGQAHTGGGSGTMEQPWSPGLVQSLGICILVFCLIVLAIAAFLLRGRDDSVLVLKVFGLILILCLSAFLMVVGYGQDQLTPIVGLFGAIAGYILGKEKQQA